MNESQQLRESMWDLVYGLLSPEESEALIVRIKSNPEAARLYSEVRLQADLVGQAARVEDSSVVVTLDGAAKPVPAKRSAAAGRSSASSASWGDSHRGGAWLAGVAMTALAVLLMVGFFWPRPDMQQLASSFVSIDVTGQQSLPAGLTSQVAVRTSRASYGDESDEGKSSSIELRLLDRTGKERFRKAVQTNEIGQAQVEIPGDALEPGVRLEVAAADPVSDAAGTGGKKMKQQSSLAAALPVNPEPQLAYFLLGEPQLESDKQVPFSLWSFSAFSAKPASDETSQAALETVDGLVRADPAASSRDGQVNGTLQLGAGEKERARSFAYRDRADKSAAAKDSEGRTEIAAGEPITMEIPPQLAGKLVDVSAVCRGVIVATDSVPEGKTRSEGAQSKGAQLSGGLISLALPPEADGLIEVNWFDRSSNESEPAQRDIVYRQPLRRIQVELPEIQERFAPGQEVVLMLRCTDESGKPAADTRLGIRVWNERLIQESGEQPVLLADAVRGGSPEALREVVSQRQQSQLARRGLADADRLSNLYGVAPPDDKRLADDAQSVAVAGVALGESIQLANNREQVKSEIREVYARAEAQRQRAIQIIGGAAMFGGIAVLLLMGMLALFRMTVGLRTMSSALVAALASVFVGLAWIGWLPQAHKGQIAMAPAPTTSEMHPADAPKSGSETETVAAPALPAIVSSEALTAGSKLSDEVPTAAASTADKPRAEPASPITLRQNAAAAETASTPASVPQEASNLRLLELQREEQKVDLADKRAAGGRGGAGGMSEGRAAIANGPAAKARPLPAPQLSADASANERRSSPSALGGAAPARQAGAAGAAAAKSEAATAPPSLYFNPQLMTDAEGRATVRFVMPQVASEYRLLIDALGQGRIGSRQQVIVCGSPAAAK